MSQFTNSDYKAYTVRSAAILTNSYVAGTVIGGTEDINLQTKNELIVLVDFTIGSLTSGEIKIEYSPDGTTYYQETVDAVNTTTGVITERLGTRTFAATGKYRIAVPIMDKYIKISANGTGTVTDSSMAITALIGNV